MTRLAARSAAHADARRGGIEDGASDCVASGPRVHAVRGAGGAVVGLRPVTVEDADVGLLVEQLAAVVGDRGSVEGMPASALKDRVAQLRRLSGLADAGLARTVAALDRAGGVASDGAPSKAEWIKANTGRSGRDAARMQRLADNLDELPATADALASGELTTEAADAIVHASRDGRLGSPDDVETDLVPVATNSSPEQLRRHIRRRQQQADGAALLRQEQRQHAMRDLSMTQVPSGAWHVRGMLPGELGTKWRTALDAFDPPDPPDAVKRRPGARLVDALEALVDTVLDDGMAPGTGGVARPHLSVLVDLSTIDGPLHDAARGGVAATDGQNAPEGAVPADDPTWAEMSPGTTSWGGLLSPQAIRRLLCDASVSRIVTDGPSQVLDVGRATRIWSEPQRRAVNARDRGCRGPNCTRPIAWTQVHHLRWWGRDRGPTNLENGLALCHHCHRLVHDHGWTVTLDPTTARATWTSPSGSVVAHLPDQRFGRVGGSAGTRIAGEPRRAPSSSDPPDSDGLAASRGPDVRAGPMTESEASPEAVGPMIGSAALPEPAERMAAPVQRSRSPGVQSGSADDSGEVPSLFDDHDP